MPLRMVGGGDKVFVQIVCCQKINSIETILRKLIYLLP